MKSFAFRGALAVSTALSFIVGHAAAQQAPVTGNGTPLKPAAATNAPEAIVVTARRKAERLQNVPISIKVFNQQTLNNRNILTAEDLARNSPSLSADTNFGNQNTTFAIRGFVQDSGTQPSVGTYFADVVSPRGGSNNLPVGDGANAGSFFDLQNVQILKGPQGTLFGRNTTGGAVLLVPQKPTSDFDGYLETSYGNYDMKRVQSVVNIPLSDTIRFRLGVDHADRDGYAKNNSGIGPSHFDDLDYTAVRASLVVDVTPDIENYSIFSYSRSDENGDLQKLVGCNPNPSLRNLFGTVACGQLAREKGTDFYTLQNPVANPSSILTTFQGINTTTWKATDDLTVKNILSYAELKDNLTSALFGTDFDLHDFLPFFPKGSPLNFTGSFPAPNGNTAHESTFSEELQVQGTALDTRLTYQGGIYVELADPLGVAGSQSPVLANCSDPATFKCKNPLGVGVVNYTAGRQRSKDIGVYSQATYSLTDELKLTGGIRYTWDNETDQSQGITYAIPSLKPSCTNPGTSGLPNCNVSINESTRAPTWLIDLDYKPFPQTLLYAKYVRGYRAGGIEGNLPAPFDTFQAERVNTYEAGVKQTFLGDFHGLLDIDGFYNDFANQQLAVGFDAKPGSNVSPASGIVNAGKSRIFGAEVSASVTPFPGFTAEVDYTYLNTQITAISAFVAPADSPYFLAAAAGRGDRLALSPTNNVTISGTYRLPIEEGWGKLLVGASFIYTDPQLSNYADQLGEITPGVPNLSVRGLSYLQSRHLLNLNLNWNSIHGSPFDLSLFATNVTGDKYYTFVPGLYSANLGFETAQLGQPTFYGARLRYNFGFSPRVTLPPPAEAVPVPIHESTPARTYLVFFDWDRADLTDRARQIVAAAASAAPHVQTTRIEVNGYTDLSGTAAYNQRLSVRRAQSVRSELLRDGVAANEIAIHGFGESNPLVPTAQGVREPQNRRVEIILN